ncbi:S1C family serine protease [Marisediminicola antarctica]|uniref:S1C family serine protease n=1 Tax=Marisediminicola antarctica TaxID=674079 RepID=UPI00137AEF1B|nr:trypsin-like peptidase domain-containing protein [Marisediminicola antarctica]
MTDENHNQNPGSETPENPNDANATRPLGDQQADSPFSHAPTAPVTPAPTNDGPPAPPATTPSSGYGQPAAPPPSGYVPPAPGVVPPAFRANATTEVLNPEGFPSAPAPAANKPAKRGSSVSLIAALAIGALVGGVSGAGVTAIAMGSAPVSETSNSSNGPANITVNDPSNATTVTAVAAAAGPSVVTISVADGSGAGGTGSGVIISEDGYVLTNAHVVTLDGAAGSPTVSVQASDGRLYKAEIVGADPISDLAVIKIDGGNDFEAAEFADSGALNVGDSAIAIGAPLGLSNTVTTGIVSSLNRSITVASSAAPQTPDSEAPDGTDPFDFWRFDTPEGGGPAPSGSSTIALSVIQTDAAINPGNSGGALLDSDGKVIGINVAIASAGGGGQSTAGSIGVGFAIPSNVAKRVAQELIETGTGSHGLLGATVSDVTSDTAPVVGAQIQQVSPGGAAADGGLKSGDIITSINGLPVTGKTDLTAQVRALPAGAEAEITYVRDGKRATTGVTLGSLG